MMATIVGFDATFLYDVGDPLHPRSACRISNTSMHIVSGSSFEYLVPQSNGSTSVILHSLGSNKESVAATFHADLSGAHLGSPFASVSWTPGATVIAYTGDGAIDSSGLPTADVWLATSTTSTRLYTYSTPGIDGFARPGPPSPVLAVSPDGEYLVAGWAISSSIRVFRISGGADISPGALSGIRSAFWARTGHTLYAVSDSGVQVWSPEAGAAPFPNTTGWTLGPNLSPDGTQVAFTAVTTVAGIRTFVYDLKTQTSRVLINQPRSSVTFIKAGWVWEIEERPCVQSPDYACFDPTVPDTTVLAINLATGQESPVTFGAGETPVQAPYGYMAGGDLWPLG
jgi:hypothetical protein